MSINGRVFDGQPGLSCRVLITHSVGARWMHLIINYPLNSAKCILWTRLTPISSLYKYLFVNEVQKVFLKTSIRNYMGT